MCLYLSSTLGLYTATSPSPSMPATPVLPLLCSLLTLSSLSPCLSDQQLSLSQDYTNEEYGDFRYRRQVLEMQEMEQNTGINVQSNIQSQLGKYKRNLLNISRQRRQTGDVDMKEESAGDSEPLLVEDPKGWGLAEVLGEL